jgi:quercetin dioxygenase-like cupin family protein
MILSKQEMHEKVYHLGENSPEPVGTRSVRWLLARNDNVALYVYDGMPGSTFAIADNREEILIYVIDSFVTLNDGRVVRAGEAAFQCPGGPFGGKFTGTDGIRFIAYHVTPLPGASPAKPELMKGTIRLDDMKPVRRPGSGSYAWNLVETESTSVTVAENRPVLELDDPGHPEAEIVYVVRGKIEYLNGPGRVVRAGECITNVPDMAHPFRYAGTEPVRIIEATSPPYGKPRPVAPAGKSR